MGLPHVGLQEPRVVLWTSAKTLGQSPLFFLASSRSDGKNGEAVRLIPKEPIVACLVKVLWERDGSNISISTRYHRY